MKPRTGTIWHRLMGTRRAGATATLDEDRRRSPRFHGRQAVQFRRSAAETSSPPATGQLRDVSLGGISLLAEEEFRPGDLLSVQLPGQQGRATSVLACVVHARPQAEGGWLIGCTFAGPLSPGDLRTMEPGLGVEEGEQRARPRQSCALAATCRLVDDEADAGWPARVLNLSTTGIGLSVDRPVAAGKLLSIDLGGERLLGCAVHVTEQGAGEWLVGCNFIAELSEAQFAAIAGGTGSDQD